MTGSYDSDTIAEAMKPTPPARLAPGMPHCWYCYPPVEWARAQRMDRDRRRVHRRAMRRYKRTSVRLRQTVITPRASMGEVHTSGRVDLQLRAL